MTFSWIDFLIGFFLANAIPHFVVGVMDIRFLSLFGFGAKQNILYSLWNLFWAVAITWYVYGLDWLMSNGLFLGAAFILVSYFVSGRFLYLRWKQD